MHRLLDFVDLPVKYHLVYGAMIRVLLIIYGNYHDATYHLPYTDIDYKVFTDAARHVFHGNSPYDRHTYRYSPLIAFMLIPNVCVKEFGKFLFVLFDLLITVAVKRLVEYQLGDKSKGNNVSLYCALLWLYNPLSIGISTRGNADSVPCFFVIASLFFLQTDFVPGLKKYALAGFMLAVSIHLRLYPLAFSFPMYLSLGTYKITRNSSFKDGMLILWPNKNQLVLALSCVTTLTALTYGMYMLYGYEFLFETYIYHLFRKDTRHNFSILFYYSYLTTDHLSFDILKTIAQIFEVIILFVLSLAYGTIPATLPFAMFCQAVVMVAYNSVMTSQYFIWFLSLLPLISHSVNMAPAKAFRLSMIWACAQSAWLFYAYLLEFSSREVFILLWLKSIVFFCANIYGLVQVIKCYTPGYGFGEIKLEIKRD